MHPFDPNLQFETERLILRHLRQEDLDALSEIHADEETMRYMGRGVVLDRNATWISISWMLGEWLLHGYGMLAVVEKSSGKLVGRVGFLNPEGWPDFELGWMIARAHWGKGYASEAARCLFAYARDTLKQPTVISMIRSPNHASIRVAEKLGMQFDRCGELFGSPIDIYRIRFTDC